jgi:hypothetical protein
LDYWRGIRAVVNKIQQIPSANTDLRAKAIDSFFEEEIKDNPEFTMFENRVIDVYIEKIY